MSYLISGKMRVEGTNGKGESYSATNIYLLETITSQYGTGMRIVQCPKSFVKDGKRIEYNDVKFYIPSSVMSYDDILVNKKCEVSFDQYGNIKGIQF